ncbi:MAG: hypothetical protein KAS23_05030 [Anaerohalosphaera sp.]|nr:hypothetical protein [Anaerohalosphaera sp.]
MTIEDKTWMLIAQTVAKRFIEKNYPHEAYFFESLWETLLPRICTVFESSSGEQVIELANSGTTDISLVGNNNVGLLSTTIASTIIEASYEIDSKKPDDAQLRSIIASAAARHGAKPSLVACLEQQLPELFNSLLTLDVDAPQALVREVPRPLYKIWTKGGELNCSSDVFSEYDMDKMKYLFWIDINATRNYSHIVKGKHIGQTATKLLKYLVDDFGKRSTVPEVLNEVFNVCEDSTKNRKIDEGKIERQFSHLQAYSEGQFRQYLLDEKFLKGIGLKESFREKYFLYVRLR